MGYFSQNENAMCKKPNMDTHLMGCFIGLGIQNALILSMTNNDQRENKMQKAIDQIKNTKGIFWAEKINRIARYLSNKTGMNLQIATRIAQDLI